jgi:hypothetical protein
LSIGAEATKRRRYAAAVRPPPDSFSAAAGLEGVPSALAAARDGIDARLRDRGWRRSSPQATAESLLRGAAASAALEAGGYDVEALRSGSGDPVAQGALRLATELLSLLAIWERAPLQALARMHALAAGGLVAADQLGRPRDEPAATRLRELAQQLRQPTTAPALLVAALVHAELATVAPFGSADGVVARAAERLVLVSRGVDPNSVTVPEAGHLALAASYRAALAGYAAGGVGGVRGWLLHAAQAYARGAEAAVLEV